MLRIAGKNYRNEAALFEAMEQRYRSPVYRKMKPKPRKRRLLIHILLKNGRTFEVCYLEVGVRGMYVRYVKERPIRFRPIGRRKGPGAKTP